MYLPDPLKHLLPELLSDRMQELGVELTQGREEVDADRQPC